MQNITFEDGFTGVHQATCTANIPRCWYGGVDGGGAIYIEGGRFKAINSRFVDNRCYAFGPDLGGGAIRVLAQYQNRPVYITNDTFTGGRCSNGGALSSISVGWEVLNSVFTNNRAVGWGANPASRGTPGGGSGGAIYLDGTDDNVLIAGSVMDDDHAREGRARSSMSWTAATARSPSTSRICTTTPADSSRHSPASTTTSTGTTDLR